jgi:hypothetical protein
MNGIREDKVLRYLGSPSPLFERALNRKVQGLVHQDGDLVGLVGSADRGVFRVGSSSTRVSPNGGGRNAVPAVVSAVEQPMDGSQTQ